MAKKAEAYLKKSGIGDTSYFGPELEFFIFNDIRFEQNSHQGYYFIDSEEGIWNSGKEDDATTWVIALVIRKDISRYRLPTSSKTFVPKSPRS